MPRLFVEIFGFYNFASLVNQSFFKFPIEVLIDFAIFSERVGLLQVRPWSWHRNYILSQFKYARLFLFWIEYKRLCKFSFMDLMVWWILTWTRGFRACNTLAFHRIPALTKAISFVFLFSLLKIWLILKCRCNFYTCLVQLSLTRSIDSKAKPCHWFWSSSKSRWSNALILWKINVLSA